MSQEISITSRPKVLNDVIWRGDGENDQIIILSREGLALPLILNPSAARIFSLCNGENTLEDIANNLCGEFGLDDFGMVLKDVRIQIEYFIKKAIVKS